MTDEIIQEKAEELFGKVDKTFPITEFAKERDRKCFKQGAQWAKQQMIEEACEWLKENIYNRVYECGDKLGFPTADFIEDFKQAMEEQA